MGTRSRKVSKKSRRTTRRLRRRQQRGGLLPIPNGSLVATQQDPYSPTVLLPLEIALEEKDPIRF
jgi:hypothetical protein